jgi:probable rRNA maturation factor
MSARPIRSAPRGIDVAVTSRVPQRLVSAARATAVVRAALADAGVRHAAVSVALVDKTQMARLHRKHLGKRGATDVITFAFERATAAAPLVADIYIAPDVVRENARAYGVSAREELLRVLVHGALHAAGLDHPENQRRTSSAMWRRQERLLRTLQ